LPSFCCYKLGDQLTQSLTRPFLIDMGYDAFDRGVALTTLSVGLTIAGTVAGGLVTTAVGLGHALWIFGVVQIFSNAGYLLLACWIGPTVVAMYGATGFEVFAAGLGWARSACCCLRLTKAVLGHAVRALLQPVCRAAGRGRPASRASRSAPSDGRRSSC
jgi:PAT family beta-lactamase induction signal transducer AmpG